MATHNFDYPCILFQQITFRTSQHTTFILWL